MRLYQLSLISLLPVLLGPALLFGAATSATAPSDALITSEELEAHVRFLASDELRGRKTGSPESKLASEYLARMFQQAGLEPAGDEGTFFQAVPLELIEYTGKPELHFLAGTGEDHVAEWGVDFDLAGGDLYQTTSLILSTVNSDEDLPGADSPMRAFFLNGSRDQTREWVGKLRVPGRAGLILEIGRTEAGSEKTRNPRGPRNPQLIGDYSPPRVRLRADWIDRARAGDFVSVKLVQPMEKQIIAERNVVGKITGVGTPEAPDLAKQTLVYTAHFDHIGLNERAPEPVEGEVVDVIRNGADDDASGVAAVLELAQAYAAGKRPARTLVFLLVTGEEVGLLGTDYYLDHPVVPLEDTVCNLNFEMIGRPDELVGGAGHMWLTGHELSTLAQAVEQAGESFAPDPRPDQQFFKRSDNYAFVKRGIVAQTLSSYNMHLDYHRPSDEADTLDYEHMETCVRAALRGFTLLVDGSSLPAWREGIDPSEL